MDWPHFETIISSSTFTISGLITSSFGIPVMQRRPLEWISSLKSKWILSFSILTQALLSISLQLPLILKGPTEIHCDPECECGNMSPRSKGSSWHVPHNLMWGFSPPEPWYPLFFFSLYMLDALFSVGGGRQWSFSGSKTLTHCSWSWWSVKLHFFSWVKHFIVTPF